jgi:hypothetical protein
VTALEIPASLRTLSASVMLSRFALTAAVLIMSSAVRADDSPASTLYGKVEGEVYTAPNGVYSVTIPVLPEFGGQVHDTENVVTFDDNVNTHASIACFPMDLTQKWDFESRGAREYLASFYAEFVLRDFQNRYPGTTAETTLFVPAFLDGSLLGFALLPGGSVFEGRDAIAGTPKGEPAVAKRGNLLFIKSGCIYVLSIELAERVTQRSVFIKKPAEEDEILRERLMKLAGRIRFPAPKVAPKAPSPTGND